MSKGSFVGIDLHKNNFTAYFLKKDTSHFEKFDVSEQGIQNFLLLVSKKDQIAVEATGNSRFFKNSVEPYVSGVTVVPPTAFAMIKDSTKKTDKNDAALLAFFLSKNMLPNSRTRTEIQDRIISLVELKNHFVVMKAKLLNTLNSFLCREGIIVPKSLLKSEKSLKKYTTTRKWDELAQVEIDCICRNIAHIKNVINELNEEIEEQASLLPGYSNLISIKGIGAASAAILLCTIGNIDDFSHSAKLASFFGIVPSVRISNGKKVYGRITKKGSRLARTTLVQCTWVSVRYNAYLKKYYERLKKRKGAKRAIIACSRKFLNIIYNTLKNDWVFTDFNKFQHT